MKKYSAAARTTVRWRNCGQKVRISTQGSIEKNREKQKRIRLVRKLINLSGEQDQWFGCDTSQSPNEFAGAVARTASQKQQIRDIRQQGQSLRLHLFRVKQNGKQFALLCTGLLYERKQRHISRFVQFHHSVSPNGRTQSA